jgi:hypothetical protein
MRTVIYNYIKALGLKSVVLSSELPYQANGQDLYLKNKKTIYVDVAQSNQDAVTDTFSGTGTVNEVTTVSVYFVNDAKKILPDYDNIVTQIKNARTATGTEGYIQKLCQVTVSYDEDAMVTELGFSFRKLLTN